MCVFAFENSEFVVKSERPRDVRRHAKAKAKLRIYVLKKNCNTLNIFYVNDRKKWNNSIKYECNKQKKKSKNEKERWRWRRRNRVDETNGDRMVANDLINVRDDKNPHSHSWYVDVSHVCEYVLYVCLLSVYLCFSQSLWYTFVTEEKNAALWHFIHCRLLSVVSLAHWQ